MDSPLLDQDAFHPLVVDVLAVKAEKRGDAPINVTAILAGQIDNGLRQGAFIIAHHERATMYQEYLDWRAENNLLRLNGAIFGSTQHKLCDDNLGGPLKRCAMGIRWRVQVNAERF